MLEQIMEMVLGPFGALAVLCVVIYGIYSLGVKHLLPMLSSAVDRHLDQVDRMLEEHKEDREIFKQTIEKIVDRLDKVEDDVAYIKGKIENESNKEL
jgi:hypothetical protein